jgi:hypothetical protein
MTHAQLLAAALLAQDQPRDTGPDFGKASPFGLLVVVVLLVATFLLVWSMNRHLKKLPKSFDPDRPEPDQAADEGTPAAEVDDAPAPGSPDKTADREPGS